MGNVLIYLFLILSAARNRHEKRSGRGPSQKNDGPRDQGIIPVRAEVGFSEEEKKERRAYEEKQYAVQKSLRRATWFTFGAASVYAAITIGLWYATNRAANIASQQVEMSERPWIAVDLVSVGPITYDDPKRVKIEFAIKITNLGHSPAINVNILPQIRDRMSGPDDPVEQQKKPCVGAETIKLDQHWGRTLFPGKDYTQNFSFDLSREEVGPNFPLPLQIRSKDNWEPNILGCVDYTVYFTREHHQTYFIYDVWGTSDSGRLTRLVMGVNTPAEKIKFFTNSPFSGGAN